MLEHEIREKEHRLNLREKGIDFDRNEVHQKLRAAEAMQREATSEFTRAEESWKAAKTSLFFCGALSVVLLAMSAYLTWKGANG